MEMQHKNTKRNIITCIAIIVVFLFFAWKESPQRDSLRFFPRSEIGDLYRQYKEVSAQNPKLTSKEMEYIREAEIYYQNMSHCHITGTVHQEQNYGQKHNLVMGFDMHLPDYENETVNILKDYGTIQYDPDIEIYPKSKDFDFYACQYKKRDFLSRELSVTCSPKGGDFIMGYIRTVYQTKNGKGKSETRPLNGADIVLKTRDGFYTLKEFAVFTAYESEKNFPETASQYHIKIDGQELADFTIP